MCSSRAEREDVVRLYPFCAEWAKVIPIAVDAVLYDDVEPFETEGPVILSAGRLDRYKRVDLVVQAMREVGGRRDARDLRGRTRRRRDSVRWRRPRASQGGCASSAG